MSYYKQVEWDTDTLNPEIRFDCSAFDVAAIQVTLTKDPGAFTYTVTAEVSLDGDNWYAATSLGGGTPPALTVASITATSIIWNMYSLTPFRYMRIKSGAATTAARVLITVRAEDTRLHPRTYATVRDTWYFAGTSADAKLRMTADVKGDAGAVQATYVGEYLGTGSFALIEGSIDGVGWYGVNSVNDKAVPGSALSLTYSGGTPVIVSGVNLMLLKQWRLSNTGGNSADVLSLTMSTYSTPKGVGLDHANAY